MDGEQLMILIGRCESELLDFKEDPGYDFENEQKKGDFVKDIVAMSNTITNDEDKAYILLGVREDPNTGRGMPLGFTPNPKFYNDSKLQEFFNGKTNKKPKFNYETKEIYIFNEHDEKVKILIGIITISYIRRPIYITKSSPTWSLKQDTALLRQGSKNTIATPQDLWDHALKEKSFYAELKYIPRIAYYRYEYLTIQNHKTKSTHRDVMCLWFKLKFSNIGPCPWRVSNLIWNESLKINKKDCDIINMNLGEVNLCLPNEIKEIILYIRDDNSLYRDIHRTSSVKPQSSDFVLSGNFTLEIESDLGMQKIITENLNR